MEITPACCDEKSRAAADEMRRRAALDFIQSFRNWLQENRLDKKVSTLDVTPFGYIHITCEPDIIERARTQDRLNITAIRQAAALDQIAFRSAV